MNWEELFFYNQNLLVDRPQALQEDILKFLQHCLSQMQKQNFRLSFQDFSELWSKHEISSLSQCLLKWESEQEFYLLLLDTLQKYFVESLQLTDKTLLFYMIYAILVTLPQHLAEIQMSVNVQFITQLSEFMKLSKDDNNLQPAILYNLLMKKNKILLSTRTSVKNFALSNNGQPQSLVQRSKKTLNSRDKIPASIENSLINQIQINKQICAEYSKLKLSVIQSNPELQGSLSQSDSHLANRIEDILKNMKIIQR